MPAASLPSELLIDIRQLKKVYATPAGPFEALRGIDLQIGRGEFVAVIGKSGSGKSTFINMLSGIDHPSSGDVWIDGTTLHNLSEDQMAGWRGLNLGIIFQFFQLLPTLTLLENIILPLELNNRLSVPQRRARALYLLEQVGMAEQADKLPSEVSGGQQQRVAIARALANDPSLIIADEPTGNLDSRTAEEIFDLFARLVADGKTILMVTHDDSLAQRAHRTILISDGAVVNEYLVGALGNLSKDLLVEVARAANPQHYPPGAVIVQQGELAETFYIILEGAAEVFLERPGQAEMLVNELGPGQYFGEMALVGRQPRSATVRASEQLPVEAVALDVAQFNRLMEESPAFRRELQQVIERNLVRDELQVLAGLDYAAIAAAAEDAVVRTYQPGEAILVQGSLGDNMYVILEGQVAVVVSRPGQPDRQLAELGPGQYFGEMALLGNKRRAANVRVTGSQPARVVEINRAQFDMLLAQSGEFKDRVAAAQVQRQKELDENA